MCLHAWQDGYCTSSESFTAQPFQTIVLTGDRRNFPEISAPRLRMDSPTLAGLWDGLLGSWPQLQCRTFLIFLIEIAKVNPHCYISHKCVARKDLVSSDHGGGGGRALPC